MAKSIMQENDDICYLCGGYGASEWHHIYGASNRKWSEKYGLKVRLHHNCHNEPPNGVHHNKNAMDNLHKEGQKAFNKAHPELSFIEIFGRNYL
jgi:hypothetical protein